MKKIYFKLNYYWHVFKFNQLQGIINDCLDEQTKLNLENEISYHERSALNCIMKF
jgi:hypothetical protein